MTIQYFDALAKLPPPPWLPEEVRQLERTIFFDSLGRYPLDFEKAFKRSPALGYLFRVACGLWASRTARTYDDLIGMLLSANRRNVPAIVGEDDAPPRAFEVETVAQFVALNYSRGPKRWTKRGARRYDPAAYDLWPRCRWDELPALEAEGVM